MGYALGLQDEVDREVDSAYNPAGLGSYNFKSKEFEGKLSINELDFPYVWFTSGSSLHYSYETHEMDVLGIIFFDNKTESYAIELTNEKIYEKLTGKKYNNSPLIISSPASSIEEAKNIHDDLEMIDMKMRYSKYPNLIPQNQPK